MARTPKIRRARYRPHRRRSRRLANFLSAMETKWSGEENEIAVDSVDGGLVIASDQGVAGPFTLRGAPPPELRDVPRFWVENDGNENLTLYQSREDLGAQRNAIDIASWALELDFDSLTTVTDDSTTLSSADTVATLGTPLAVTAVTNGADSLTIEAHGLAVDDGPFYIDATGGGAAIPAGLAALTPYWISAVPDADTVKLAASLGGATINITDDGGGTITLTPVNVDVGENALYSPAHGLATGLLVRLTTSGALPTGLAVATDYWLIAVDADHLAFATSLANAQAGTRIDLTAAGSGTTTISKCRVSITDNTIETDAAHGMATGDGPLRLSTTGALPTGLAVATDYYAIVVSATVIKLATTLANALAGTAVDITAIGSGVTTITLAGADVTSDGIYVPDHGMETGDGPVRVVTSGVLPTGLAAATDYWVIAIDDDHVALASSLANALAGTEVNITGIGSGDHGLARALTIGKDLSAAGLLEWIAQGVRPDTMQLSDVADVDTVFA